MGSALAQYDRFLAAGDLKAIHVSMATAIELADETFTGATPEGRKVGRRDWQRYMRRMIAEGSVFIHATKLTPLWNPRGGRYW